MKKINIAIDGPSSAGKSTIARAIASKLGILYVDTGAMYRAIALYMLENNINISDTGAVIKALPKISLSIAHENGEQIIFLNSRNVNSDIRKNEVSSAASAVSAIPAVRSFLLDTQRGLAERESVIMDGRDIGTVILPNAEVKIFLTADVTARAKRRQAELAARGQNISFQQMLEDIISRDERDTSRKDAPLRQADDAVLVDTTDFNFEESVELVENIIKPHLN